MSESAPARIAQYPAERPAQALTPQAIDGLLADVRRWLEGLAAPLPAMPTSAAEPMDLHTLLSQFIAVRHEVNLQTKAVRGQQEQSAEVLRVLAGAVEALQRSQANAAQRSNRPLRNWYGRCSRHWWTSTMLLSWALREAQRVQDNLLPTLTELVGEPAALCWPSARWRRRPLTRDRGRCWLGLLGVVRRGAVAPGRVAAQADADRLEEAAAARQQEYRTAQQDRYRQATQGVERVNNCSRRWSPAIEWDFSASSGRCGRTVWRRFQQWENCLTRSAWKCWRRWTRAVGPPARCWRKCAGAISCADRTSATPRSRGPFVV